MNNKEMSNDSMNSMSMMNNSFFGEVSQKNDEKISKECAFIGLIKSHRLILEDELKEAKLKFADVALERENWSGKYEREMACKVIEGQISMLNRIESDFENMLTPIEKPVMAGMPV